MKMKKLKTGTAMALTLVMMGAPMIKASASEVEKSGVSYEEKLEYVNREKAEFQEEYGKEDKFKLIYEDEFFKEEVNGATGEIRMTTTSTGEVQMLNFFNDLEEELKASQMSEKEYLAQEKVKFEKEYGTENKFKVTHEDESVKEEVNGATGDVRITDKETGKVTVDNFYEATKEQHKRYKMTEDEHDKYLEKQFKINFGK